MSHKKQIYSRVCSLIGKRHPVLLSYLLFYISQHKRLNLKNPLTFNEKLMWIKIHNYFHNPIVWRCADKYLVRNYAKSCGVSEHNLPKLLKVYQNAAEIDFDELPQRFALKCSHGYGFNVICTDKAKLDQEKTRKQLQKWLKTKFGYATAENHYTHIAPCLICEEFIEFHGDKLPIDYKIYCFHGEPKFLCVVSERETGAIRLNWYDFNWDELFYGHAIQRAPRTPAKPKSLPEMVEIARKVSRGFPFVRVDFYEQDGKAIMGEMTFTPAADIATYYNDRAQLELGGMLNVERRKLK